MLFMMFCRLRERRRLGCQFSPGSFLGVISSLKPQTNQTTNEARAAAPPNVGSVQILAMLRMLEALFPHLRRLILRQRDTGVNAQLLEESSPDYEADNAGDRKSAPSQLPPLQVDNDADLVAIYQGVTFSISASFLSLPRYALRGPFSSKIGRHVYWGL